MGAFEEKRKNREEHEQEEEGARGRLAGLAHGMGREEGKGKKKEKIPPAAHQVSFGHG